MVHLVLALAALLFTPALTFFEKNLQRWPLRSDGKWNRHGQWNPRRRGGNHTAAQFTLHTFEAALGAKVLAGATYLLQRKTPGSYHWLFDVYRKHLHLAPWSAETWHSVPTNNFAASASAMMHAADWRRLNAAPAGSQLAEWRDNIVYGFALAAADFSAWLISEGRDPVPKRILTTAQALRGEAGFVMHRDTDPGRRRDPADPRDEFPWDEFFTEYDRLLAELTGTTPARALEEDDDMKTHYIFTNGDHQYWLNPRDWTIRPVEGRHDSGASHKAEIKTIVEAVGDELKNWRDRPNAGSKSDELAAVGNFNYAGPAAQDPRKA